MSSVNLSKSWSNLLLANNGATSLKGNSSKIAFHEDRERVRKIRDLSSVILIGGNTLRTYPYQKMDKQILVSSRREVGTFKNIHFFNLSPLDLLEYATKRYSSPLLIEGGVNFVKPLIQNRRLETLFLGRSNTSGDDNFFDEDILEKNYHLVYVTEYNQGRLETWSCL
jgi:dihydrofolate reductase